MKVTVFWTNNPADMHKGYAGHVYKNKLYPYGVVYKSINYLMAVDAFNSENKPYPLRLLKGSINLLIKIANEQQDHKFYIKRLTSHDLQDYGPMFAEAPTNMVLPFKLKSYVFIDKDREYWSG